MKLFTITSDLNIAAYETSRAPFEFGLPTFTSERELDKVLAANGYKPVDLWNTLPGLTPVKKFMNRNAGIARIWKQLQSLEVTPEPVEDEADAAAQAAHTPREGSKQAQVVEMLKTPAGATLDAIMTATGWQRHTVRGFIAGAAQKKLHLTIHSFKNAEGLRTYRVATA